jgi:16S rRNA (cytidine1402-2'-O)-methyltransferase
MIYIIPTPIGNLDDITVRGIKVLSKAKIILCEDGKVTSKLLMLLGLQNKPKYINLVRNNQFNESGIKLALSEIYGKEISEKRSAAPVPKVETCKLPLVKGLAAKADWGFKSDAYNNGVALATTTVKNNQITIQNPTDINTDQNIIAIVTDAGTPGISDPAFEIIQLLQQLNLDYTVLPGATACIPAIVTSNLVSKEFTFLGFLPLKKGRQTLWSEIKTSKYPVVIYESCHRIAKLIEEIQTNLKPEARVSISQEISKKHENTWIGNVNQIQEYPVKDKGEFVIIIRS